MPVVTLLAGGFALNNNPPPSSGGGRPNMYLPLMGVGMLSLLAAVLPAVTSSALVPEVSLG